MTTAIVQDPSSLAHDTGTHPECPARLKAIEAALERRQVRKDTIALSARRASIEDLHRVHTAELVEQIELACRTGAHSLDPDTIICEASFDAARATAGGAITGIDALMLGSASNVFLCARPPGHHATRAQAMGFCLFNHVAVAARYAQAQYGLERVLILDWDVHHGNGTQDIFYTDPSVYFVSWHQRRIYPYTGEANERGEGAGEGFTRNVPLPAYTRAADYRAVFDQTLEEVVATFQPDLVLVSAGFDSHAQDPLGGLMLEDADFREMTLRALDIAHRYAGGRLLSVLEGGYNLKVLGDTVATHVEALKEG